VGTGVLLLVNGVKTSVEENPNGFALAAAEPETADGEADETGAEEEAITEEETTEEEA
jgi:hypothetical protein